MALFSSSRHNLALIVDVGTSSVGAAVVSLPENGKRAPLVLSSARSPLPFQEHFDFERYMTLLWRSFDIAVEKALKAAPGRPREAHCFLSSMWYASQVRTVKLHKEHGFVFERKLLENLVKKEKKAFFEEKYKNVREHIDFIEEEVLDVKLNGYRLLDPFGKRTENAEVSFFFGVSGEEMTARVREHLKKFLPHVAPSFHSFLLPFFHVARTFFPEAKDAMLIDVGGEVTDVSFMKDQTLAASASFPLGRNFLLRRACAALRKDVEGTRSTLRLLAEGKLDPEAAASLALVLGPVQMEWLESFHKALDMVRSSLLLPHRVFLLAASDVAKWFATAVEQEEYGQYTLSADKFDVTVIGASAFGNDVAFGATIGVRDEFLGIESIFAAAPRLHA
ncbi:MAG: hypothetical protein Q8Q36_01065 [bacterium]|nr:hypothetical protein [bacterium]